MPLLISETGAAELFTAYAKAQSQMGDVLKGSSNPAFRSKYADLSAVVEAVTPALTANGFALVQSPDFDGEVVTVETLIAHQGGGWIRSVISLRPTKADPQGVGSAITYGRRYALMALCGVAPEDDDGNAASGDGFGGKRFERAETKPKTAARADYAALVTDMRSCGSVADLDDFMASEEAKGRYRVLPADWQQEIVRERRELTEALRGRAAEVDAALAA